MKHDWRRGPVVAFFGHNTKYICLRCGQPTTDTYRPEIELYDPRDWDTLVRINLKADYWSEEPLVDFDKECEKGI